MEQEYEETKKELDKSHEDLTKFVNKHISKNKQKEFYKLLSEVIDCEIEMEKFCNN